MHGHAWPLVPFVADDQEIRSIRTHPNTSEDQNTSGGAIRGNPYTLFRKVCDRSLLAWRPSQVGWRPLLVETTKKTRTKGRTKFAIRLVEAIATGVTGVRCRSSSGTRLDGCGQGAHRGRAWLRESVRGRGENHGIWQGGFELWSINAVDPRLGTTESC